MAICKECGEECTLVKIDDGIGSYEFWGHKGFHHDYRIGSKCCEADYELEPNEKEVDHFGQDYD